MTGQAQARSNHELPARKETARLDLPILTARTLQIASLLYVSHSLRRRLVSPPAGRDFSAQQENGSWSLFAELEPYGW